MRGCAAECAAAHVWIPAHTRHSSAHTRHSSEGWNPGGRQATVGWASSGTGRMGGPDARLPAECAAAQSASLRWNDGGRQATRWGGRGVRAGRDAWAAPMRGCAAVCAAAHVWIPAFAGHSTRGWNPGGRQATRWGWAWGEGETGRMGGPDARLRRGVRCRARLDSSPHPSFQRPHPSFQRRLESRWPAGHAVGWAWSEGGPGRMGGPDARLRRGVRCRARLDSSLRWNDERGGGRQATRWGGRGVRARRDAWAAPMRGCAAVCAAAHVWIPAHTRHSSAHTRHSSEGWNPGGRQATRWGGRGVRAGRDAWAAPMRGCAAVCAAAHVWIPASAGMTRPGLE